MRRFREIYSVAAPWLMPNVDTDIITPMRRLILNNSQLDYYSFESFRFINGDGDSGIRNPDFPLNQAKYQQAEIMIVGENFGCGSSRETAPEAISKCGIHCLLGSSFGGIFYKNCFQQGVLPIVFPREQIEKYAELAAVGGKFRVSLVDELIQLPTGENVSFSIESFRKTALLEGLDEVDVTLRSEHLIHAYFEADRINRPWLYWNQHDGLKEEDSI